MKHRPYRSTTERNREVARQEAEAKGGFGDTMLSFTEIRGITVPPIRGCTHVIDEINHFDPEKMMEEVHASLAAQRERTRAQEQATIYANGFNSKGMFGLYSHQYHVMNYLLRDPNIRVCLTGRRSASEPTVRPYPLPNTDKRDRMGSLLEKIKPLHYLQDSVYEDFGIPRAGRVNVGTIGHVDNFTLRHATPNPVTRVVRAVYSDHTPTMATNPTILDALKSNPWHWYEPRYGSYTMKYPQLQQIRK